MKLLLASQVLLALALKLVEHSSRLLCRQLVSSGYGLEVKGVDTYDHNSVELDALHLE